MREIQAHNPRQCAIVPITHLRRIRSFAFGKSTLSASPPQGQDLCAILASEPASRINQQAQDHSPIVIGKRDQIGLHDQSAQFDQMARAFAALHLPVAPGETCVMTRLTQLQTTPRGHFPP